MSVYLDGDRICMVRGDSGQLVVSCVDSEGAERPFEAGETVVFTVKRSSFEQSPELEKVVESFTESGEAVINILPKDTEHLTVGSRWYDVRIRTKEGSVHTIIPKAKFELIEEFGHV